MIYFQLGMALAILLYLAMFDNKMLRIEWPKVGAFVGFMVFITCLRIALAQFVQDAYGPQDPIDYGLNSWTLALVFWEDLFFGGSCYLIANFIKSKWFAVPLLIAVSIWFGSGHLYQGYLVAAFACVYPYFISRRFALTSGFGTVMCCHIIYDYFSVYLNKFLPYFL